ncbi:MAG: DegT/DnrJ/EryC1/StrS family aminotransferase [Fibrobacterota bacterium]|nr:DegT/DnrJ/EryC1/StrS family aminotransferase [Fibrobacterota bacterium]
MACFALPPSGNSVPASFLLEAGDDDFPSAFSAHSGYPADRILLTASGAGALFIALRGLAALNPGRTRVVLPAWCCPSVPQTVIQAGLEPVLIDLDPSTLGYDPAALHEARDPGLLAVLLVHFFGMHQPMPAGDWEGVSFLRDCAQDFDHRQDPDDGSPCFYSFGRGKALNSGHGGALCLPTQGPLLDACREALEQLRVSRERTLPKALAINLLSQPRFFWALSRLPFLRIGATVWNAPLTFEGIAPGFHPMGSACLEAYLQRRDFYRKLTGRYRALLQGCDGDWIFSPGAGKAHDPAGPMGPAGTPHSGLPTRFPVMVRDGALREDLFRGVNARFGGVTRMYPKILTEISGAPSGLGAGRDFPGARRIADGILTLPMTAELMGRDEGFVQCLVGILEKHGALRKRPEPDPASAMDWPPTRDFRRRPSLFPTS